MSCPADLLVEFTEHLKQGVGKPLTLKLHGEAELTWSSTSRVHLYNVLILCTALYNPLFYVDI